jgi:transposase
LSSYKIRHYIEKTFGVSFQPSGVKALLHRLGFVYKKPKHVPGQLDSQSQQKPLEYYEQYNSVPSYGWIRRGKDKE